MVLVDLDLIALLALSVAPLLVLGSLYYLKKTKVNRSISKQNDSSILNHYNVLMNINEDQQAVIKSVTQKSKMLQKKIMELEGYEEEVKEETIDLSSVLPLAQKLGIDPTMVNSILQSDDAKKFISKNKGIIQSVLPLLLAKGRSNTLDTSSLPANQAWD